MVFSCFKTALGAYREKQRAITVTNRENAGANLFRWLAKS